MCTHSTVWPSRLNSFLDLHTGRNWGGASPAEFFLFTSRRLISQRPSNGPCKFWCNLSFYLCRSVSKFRWERHRSASDGNVLNGMRKVRARKEAWEIRVTFNLIATIQDHKIICCTSYQFCSLSLSALLIQHLLTPLFCWEDQTVRLLRLLPPPSGEQLISRLSRGCQALMGKSRSACECQVCPFLQVWSG